MILVAFDEFDDDDFDSFDDYNIKKEKRKKRVILSKWILLIWIKEKGGDDDCYSRLFFTKSPIFATM